MALPLNVMQAQRYRPQGGGGASGIPPIPDIFGGGGPRQMASYLGGGGAGGFPGIPGPPPGFGGGAPAALLPTGAPPAGATTNTAALNPGLTDLAAKFNARLGQDPTQRAIDRSTSNIRDTASGLMKEAKTNAARRGVFGQGDSGILQGQEQKIGDAALRAAAGAGAGISLGREQDIDRLITAGPSIVGAAPQLALQEKQLGLAQQGQAQQAQLAQMQAAMQQQQMLANLWGTYMGMLR